MLYKSTSGQQLLLEYMYRSCVCAVCLHTMYNNVYEVCPDVTYVNVCFRSLTFKQKWGEGDEWSPQTG